MKQKVDVNICGKKHTVVGSESAEYMQKVGQYIDEKMSKLIEMNDELTSEKAAILTAINIADDYFKAMETCDNLRAQIGDYLKKGKS